MKRRFFLAVLLVLATAVPVEAAGRAKGKGFGMRPPPGFQRAPESLAGGLQDRMGSMVQGAALSVLGEPERFVYTGKSEELRGQNLVVLNWRTPNQLVGALDATVLHEALRDVLGDDSALPPRPITLGDSIHGLRLFLPPFGQNADMEGDPQTIVLAQMPGRLLAFGFEGPGAGQRTPATWWRPVLDSITFEAAEESGLPLWMLGGIGGGALLLVFGLVFFLRRGGSEVPGEAAAILLQRSTMPPAPEPGSSGRRARPSEHSRQVHEPAAEPVLPPAPAAPAPTPAPVAELVTLDEQPAGMPGVDAEMMASGGFTIVKGRPPKGVNAQQPPPGADHAVPRADHPIQDVASTGDAKPGNTQSSESKANGSGSRPKGSGKKGGKRRAAKKKQSRQDGNDDKKDGGGPRIVRNVDFVS